MPVGVQAPRERAQLAPRLVCKRGHVGEARVLQRQAADELPGRPVGGGRQPSGPVSARGPSHSLWFAVDLGTVLM